MSVAEVGVKNSISLGIVVAIFCVIFSLVISILSFYLDFNYKCETYWFPRAGALLALSGAILEFSKLMKLWGLSKQTEQSIESVESRIDRGAGIGMRELATESVHTRNFTIRIYNVLTQKDITDKYAFILVVAGTVIWAYGDIPFVFGWFK